MKNLSLKSKNILAISMVFLVGILLDLALHSYIFTAGAAGVAAVPFINMTKTPGCNMAGIATTLYVIRTEDIASYPTLGPRINPRDIVTYVGDFILKPNKYWTTIYSTKEMGQILGAIEGATDGKFYRQKGIAFYPRTTPDALGMASMFKDEDVIVILKEFSGGGQMRVIGSADIPASIWGSEDSGKAYGDAKGITFDIESAGCTLAKVYNGSIITDTTVLYAPVRLPVDATVVDVSLGKRFVIGANTAPKVLSFSNMEIGDVVRVEFDALSAVSAAFTGEFAAMALINTNAEWFEVTKTGPTAYVITDGSFA